MAKKFYQLMFASCNGLLSSEGAPITGFSPMLPDYVVGFRPGNGSASIRQRYPGLSL